MSSSRRSVRFDAATKGSNNSSGENDNKRPRSDADDRPFHPKQKRFRPNEDELDDIDDYEADQVDGDNNQAVPSEREMLEAKRQRRRGLVKQVVGEESTHIDGTTSLAADGIAIEPFHMRQEESDGTGYFDGDTYVFRKNPDGDEEPDAWLDSLTDENGNPSSQLAPSSSTSMVSLAERTQTDSNQKPMDSWSNEDLYARILPLLSDAETVSQAVRRYGQLVKQNHRGKRKPVAARSTTHAPSQETQDMARNCLNDLTGAANALLLKGEVDIYDATKSYISLLLPKRTHEKITSKLAPAQWEYMGNLDGEIHGPYTTEQMITWTQAGYFIGEQKVKIRTIRRGPLSTKDDLLADLMDDDDDDDKDERHPIKNDVRGEWVWSSAVDFAAYVNAPT